MGSEYTKKYPGTQSSAGSGGGFSVPERSFPNSARLDALKSGAMKPSVADKGRQFDLKAAMRERMEKTFGADFSRVKTYESQTVADAGADAVAQGNEIAFAPGKTDFSSRSGQELLGHELSHVASQARGEVTGHGFLSDSGLEARADREGSLAARGGTVSGGDSALNGGAVAPLSSASAAPMQGPMQAQKPEEEEKAKEKANKKKASQLAALAGKRDKLMEKGKTSTSLENKYQNMLYDVYSNEDAVREMYKIRQEKREKEIKKGPGTDYHSQDRYNSAIKDLENMSTANGRRNPEGAIQYNFGLGDQSFEKHRNWAAEQERRKPFMEKASKLAKLHEKKEKLRASRKYLSRKEKNEYDTMLQEAAEGGDLYKAMLLKRNEKRRKEMEIGPFSNYRSQDRYNLAIKEVRKKQDDIRDSNGFTDEYKESLKNLRDVEGDVQSELGNDFVDNSDFYDFRNKRDGYYI